MLFHALLGHISCISKQPQVGGESKVMAVAAAFLPSVGCGHPTPVSAGSQKQEVKEKVG